MHNATIVILSMLAMVSGAFDAAPLLDWVTAETVVQFSPLTISDCVLWLDGADTSTMYDSVSGGSLVSNNGSILRWNDKSVKAAHATTANASRAIRYDGATNGKTALYFDSVDLYNVPVTNTQNFTVFYVFNPLVDTGHIAGRSKESAFTFYFWALQSNGGAALVAQFGYPTYYKNGTDLLWSPVTNRDTAYTAFANQWNIVSISNCLYTDYAAGFYLGDATSPMTGFVAEHIIYDRVLNTDEMASVEDYLKAKWGL